MSRGTSAFALVRQAVCTALQQSATSTAASASSSLPAAALSSSSTSSRPLYVGTRNLTGHAFTLMGSSPQQHGCPALRAHRSSASDRFSCALPCTTMAQHTPSSYPGLRFSSTERMSGLDLTLPVKKDKFADLPIARTMLPNRQDIQPQFTPHGVLLIPRYLGRVDMERTEAYLKYTNSSASAGTAAGRTSTHGQALASELSEEADQEVIEAIGIKMWRRLKMKKHKIRKRRRADRFKS